MRRISVACALALLAACQRDLSVPPSRTLVVSPGFAAIAPRERVVLAAAGGSAPYSAEFAQGGRLSGDDATVSAGAAPGELVYRAGSLGSAQDVVVVRDAAGAVATVRFSVGARLRVSPVLAVTSPGGAVSLAASGGKPPYAFELAGAQAGTRLVASGDPDSRDVVVGPLGDRLERVVVTDATFDPADAVSATAEATIQVSGALRLYANAPAEVPPHETVDFLAVGGQPPYEFAFATAAAPSGGSIDPLSGRYVAGPAGAGDGSVIDEIVVRDALGQASAPWPLAVGAPLRLELPATTLAPGVPEQLVASGGKPPYAFGFAARGNRSAGDVNAASGVYTPGANQGTADLLAVWDATGVASFVLSEPSTVGYMEVRVAGATGRAIEARLRGDRRPDNDAPRQDALLTHYDGSLAAGLSALLLPPLLPPQVSTGYVRELNGLTFAADLDGDAHDEVVGLGPAGLVVLETDLLGNLSLARAEGPSITRATRGPPLPASPITFHTATVCNCGGASAQTTWPSFACAQAGAGVYRIEFAGSTVPRWTCDLLPDLTGLPTSGGVAAGDLDGDGAVDLAWMTTGSSATLHVSYRAGGALGAPVILPLPCTVQPIASNQPFQSDGRLVSYLRGDGAADTKSFLVASLMCTDTSPAQQKVLRVDGGSPGARLPFASPAAPVELGRAANGISSLRAISASTGAPQHVAVFSGGLYDIHGVSFDPAGNPSVFTALARQMPSSMQWVAFPDMNGDEVPDILIAGTNPIVRYLYGDGDGRFGVRARFQGKRSWGIGRLDGDDLDDLAALDNSPALAVAFGGGHQLAWAPARAVPGGGAAIAAGDFGRGPEIVHSEFIGGNAYRTLVNPDGTLQEPQPIAASVPNVRVLHPRRFEGGVGAMDFWSNTSGVGVLLFDSAASPLSARWAGTPLLVPLDGLIGCVYYPVGVGSAAFPVEAVALCRDFSSSAILRLLRTSLPAGGGSSFSSWVEVPAAGLPAGVFGSAAEVVGAGTLDDGSAWFIATPGGTDGARKRYAVRVAPASGDPHGDPAVTVIELGTDSAVGKVSAALVGDLDGAAGGAPEILLLGGGKLSVYAWQGGTSATRVHQVGAAGSSIEALVKLAPGTSRDVLLRAADDAIIVRNAGGVNLQ